MVASNHFPARPVERKAGTGGAEHPLMDTLTREYGTLVLPLAEVASLRQHLRTAQNREHVRVYRAAQRFWAGLHPKPADRAALEALHAEPELIAACAGAGRPSAPRRCRVQPPLAPGGCRRYQAGPGASIVFCGRRVTWQADGDIAAAHANPVARAFFAHLNGLRWRPETGGEIYFEDEWAAAGLEPSASFRFGPLGEAKLPVWARQAA